MLPNNISLLWMVLSFCHSQSDSQTSNSIFTTFIVRPKYFFLMTPICNLEPLMNFPTKPPSKVTLIPSRFPHLCHLWVLPHLSILSHIYFIILPVPWAFFHTANVQNIYSFSNKIYNLHKILPPPRHTSVYLVQTGVTITPNPTLTCLLASSLLS